eukprot:5049_1
MYYLLFVGLLHIVSGDIIWLSTMISNDYSNWTISNGNPPNYLSNNGDCPSYSGNQDKCWEICNHGNGVDDYIYRIASTEGYYNITLTFNLALFIMDDNWEYCRLYYNLNDSGDSNWLTLYDFGAQGSQKNDFALQLPASASNNAGFGIKILPDGDQFACCLMSNVYVSGTSSQITATPTTSSPTTSDPTTNNPTTVNPTMNPTVTPTMNVITSNPSTKTP